MTEPTPHAAGPVPSRATRSLTISWGLITIPVKLYSASEDKAVGVSRGEYTADGHKVGRASIDKDTGALLDRSQVVKLAEAESGALVELTDEEIEAHTAGASEGAIECFIPLAAIGSEYVATGSAYVRPAGTGSGRSKARDVNVDRAFLLLTQAMAEKGVAALVKLAGRGPARNAAILPDGRCLTLAFNTEVREAPPLPEAEFSAAEVAMAKQLIESVGVSTPVLEDTVTPLLRQYVEAKAAGSAPVAAAAPEVAPVADLEAALAASLAKVA